jgi:hypothetical protein
VFAQDHRMRRHQGSLKLKVKLFQSFGKMRLHGIPLVVQLD